MSPVLYRQKGSRCSRDGRILAEVTRHGKRASRPIQSTGGIPGPSLLSAQTQAKATALRFGPANAVNLSRVYFALQPERSLYNSTHLPEHRLYNCRTKFKIDYLSVYTTLQSTSGSSARDSKFWGRFGALKMLERNELTVLESTTSEPTDEQKWRREQDIHQNHHLEYCFR